MKINDNIYGFTVTKVTEVPDISAVAYEMEYKKNGCKLLWLDRDDNNKTFAITFKTTPSDNTGVFHILEHSVLCGSDKYPLKEPFVDLLKSSMQTFLNAMTFLDKTMYPVSSRNDKDLMNLMDVYLDAVFNPLIHSKKEIFMQEGWHIEEDENGDWSYNGVVYNEMRGVFSSVDSLMLYKLLETLYPDNCYGFESGGNPKNIPDLTYEQFVATHKKFYHPSNATIVLDGNVNLDMALPQIASYIEKYDYEEHDFDIPLQKAISPELVKTRYEIAEDDDAINKTEIAKGYVFADYSQKKDVFASSVLCDILASSNDSPLKKALFSKGLAEDVYFSSADDIKQRAVFLILRGVPQGKEAEAEKVIDEEIKKLIREGIPQEQLVADINIAEFAMKEQDFGSTPAGLIFAMKVQESWLHGGDPVDSLTFNECFKDLRDSIGTSYYEELLNRIFIENDHKATIYMVPDVSLSKENEEEMKKQMAQIKAKTTEDEKKKLDEDNAKLKIFQETPDSPEVSALVPHIELSDISRDVATVDLIHGEIDGVKTIVAKKNINEIIYADLYFDLSGFDSEEIWLAAEVSDVLSQCRTENYSALDFSTVAKTYLGSLSTSVLLSGDEDDVNSCVPYFRFSVGALESNEEKIVELSTERLLKSIFDESRLLEILKQDKLSYETDLKEKGNRQAAIQARACLSARGAVNEILNGETSYNLLVKYINEPKALEEKLTAIFKRIVNAKRLTATVVGEPRDELLAKLIKSLPSFDDDMTAVDFVKSEEKNKKIDIASDVSYAVKAINIFDYMDEKRGELRVANKILSLEYLWNEVRVKGGAYGCSCRLASGDLVFSSYRDPNPDNTLKVYDGVGEALRKIVGETDDLTKYILGTIAAREPIRTPYSSGKSAIVRYLSNISDETRKRRREQILDTTAEKLMELSYVYDKIETDAVCCVVGKK